MDKVAVAEPTGLLTVPADYPDGVRIIVRRERLRYRVLHTATRITPRPTPNLATLHHNWPGQTLVIAFASPHFPFPRPNPRT